MQHLSRTALKELKKRYLNVLKKCFLANLMAFSCVTLSSPVLAETSEPALTPSEELETVVKTTRATVSKDTTIDLTGKNLTYSGIESSDDGGVFYVDNGNTLEFINSSETTDPLLLFENNSVPDYYYGGVIFNYARDFDTTIKFKGDVVFSGNTASCGGAIYNLDYDNSNATITFGGDATFSDNIATTYGGAIDNSGFITFSGETSFVNNAVANGYSGGAIYNSGFITFSGETSFVNNAVADYGSGGAIYNSGSITFGSGTSFTNNTVSGNYSGGAIYNDASNAASIMFDGKISFTDNTTNGDYSGAAIYNVGIIDFAANSSVSFEGNNGYTIISNNKYNGGEGIISFGENSIVKFDGNTADGIGLIENDGSTILFAGDVSFTNNTGGVVNDGSGIIDFGKNSSIYFDNNQVNGELVDISNSDKGTISILGTVKSDIHLASSGGTIRLKAKDGDLDGKVIYGGSYDLRDTILDISGDGVKELAIENLIVKNSTLRWDVEIKDTGNGYTIIHDTIKDAQNGIFKSGLPILSGGEKDKWYDVSFSDIYNQSLIEEGGITSYELGGFYRKKDIYDSEGKEIIGVSVNFVENVVLGDFLRSLTAETIELSQYNLIVNEGVPIKYSISDKDLINGSLFELGSGKKTIIGATENAEDTIINANGVVSVFKIGSDDELSLANLTLANSKSNSSGGAIYNQGSLMLNNVDFKNNKITGSRYIYGGAIYNTGVIDIKGNSQFLNNAASYSDGSVYGGAIYNSNVIRFEGNANFSGNNVSATTRNSSVYGGAIYNYGDIAFNGDATFTGNKANNTGISGASYGGAIYNDDEIIFEGKVNFVNNEATRKAYGGAIYNDINADITFKKEANFTGNKVSSTGDALYGGAIYNNVDGIISFKDKSSFANNAVTTTGGARVYGGAIYNYSGLLEFDKDVIFMSNLVKGGSASGGAIYNSSYSSSEPSYASYTLFDGNVYFLDNSLKSTLASGSSCGGAIYNGKNSVIMFENDAVFDGNIIEATGASGEAQGGAIYNMGTVIFKGNTNFANNSATANLNVSGGAIDNSGIIVFRENSNISFLNNTANSEYNDVYNNKGIFNIWGNLTSDMHLVSEGGSVALSAPNLDTYTGSYNLTDTLLNISENGAKNLTIENLELNNVSLKWDAEIKDTKDGYVIVHDAINSVEPGTIQSGIVNVMGGEKNKWYDVNFSDSYNQPLLAIDADVDYVITGFYNIKDRYKADTNEKIGFSVKFIESGFPQSLGDFLHSSADASFDFRQMTVDAESPIYYGVSGKETLGYSMGEMGAGEKMIIGATDKAKDTIINANGVDDVFKLGNDDKLNISNITIINGRYSSKFTSSDTSSNGGVIYNYGTVTLNNVDFKNNTASSGGVIYNYYGEITFVDGATVRFVNNKATSSGGAIYNGSTGSITFEENSDIEFINNTAPSGGAIYSSGGNYGTPIVFNGNFLFSGNKSTSTNDNGSDIYNSGGNITFAQVEGKVGSLAGGIYQQVYRNNSITNKTGAGTLILGDEMKNGYNTSSWAETQFNQTAGLTIAHTDKLTFAATNTITGGELKTHGAEINHNAVVGKTLDAEGNVVAVGSAVHYTNLEEMEINKETVGSVQYAGEDLGATIGFGSYTKAEKDAEIALMKGRIVSYTDDKGTEDTSDDEVVTYLASDKLFTTDTLEEGKITHFKVTEALDNEKGNIIAFRNASVEIDSSVGNTGATYELAHSVLESNSVANKVVSNNMQLKEGIEEYTFSELEIKEGTTLDIDNKHVTADKVTFGKESTLSVTLNHLADHGTLSHKEVAGDEEAKLVLKLTEGLEQEEGIYQVFNKDNNLALEKNGLIDIIDMQDGSYKVAKKSVETLSQELGTTKEESTVANALLSGNSDKEEFVQVQTELLDALQSENKATFARAKKALNAVGAGNTSIYQAQATAHFTQMHAVISQMLMNTSVGVFGHNGGEEPARATVYMKGLYDRVNSLTGSGFRMRSKGAVLGVQSHITEDLTVGVGYAATNTIAKEELRRTEVDTNTGFISAQYQPNDWWMSGVLTYSRSQYEEAKEVMSNKGKSSYNVDSLGVQVNTGYNVQIGDWIITPEVGVRYINARQESYEDSFGTKVDGTNSDYLTAMAGFKVGVDLKWIRPLAGVMVGYDIISDDITSVNTLANGATYKVEGKALDRLSTTVVAGFAADLGDNATLKLEYLGNYRKEYLDHSGMIRLEHKF